MLFEEDDADLLKKWIVKRLEDISDADSDVLADYVLALLRHDHAEDEVKQLCIEQLDDFLKDHTGHFVDDVFTALATKAFRSINSTLTGGHLSVNIPSRNDSPPMADEMTTSPRESKLHRDRSPGRRPQKRSYFDRDDPEPHDDERYRSAYPARDRDRGLKTPRRGSSIPSGRWNARGGTEGGPSSRRGSVGEAGRIVPSQPQAISPVVAGALPTQQPPIFGIPPMPPIGSFPPWMPPPNPNDPMTAFLTAQAAAAWGFAGGVPGIKPGEKKIVKKIGERCKDYDEKGFCMKGDMCPYEHGVDLIVVPGQETKSEEYDPNDSLLPSTSRSERGSRGGRGSSYRGRGNRGSMRGGRGGRAEFSTTGPSFDRSNTKLVVENIPDDKLTDGTIKQFFGTFGTVDNVEIHQQKNLAILTFTTWDMAKAAYDSPAPIFDNRFVKVFWCKSPGADESGSPTTPGFGGRRRFSAPRHEQHTEEDEVMEEEEKIDIEEVKKKQEELQKAHEVKMAKKKAHEEAAKELYKRQEELMKLQAEEKRKLMEKLAKKHASTASSGSPTTLGSATPSSTNGVKKSKAEDTTAILKAQLEALQAEAQALGIDQNAQEDTFDLEGFRGEGFRGRGRARGGYDPRGRGTYVPRARGYSSTFRGRGTYPPRGRGSYPPAYAPAYTPLRLDNRTKRVSVTIPDMQGDKEEEIRHHLINNGIELEASDPHPDKENTLIFTFQDRRNAEKFVHLGNEIPNVGTVIMAWFNPTATAAAAAAAAAASTVKTTTDNFDTPMADAGTPLSHQHNVKMEEDSYDLAEDDEGRWLPE